MLRDSISTSAYLEAYETLPSGLCWSLERIKQSLAATIRSRPTAGDVWVFGYGSLMWNPAVRFDRWQTAILRRWRRSFCQRLVAGRASVSKPGRMLAVQPGGVTAGVAFSIPERIAEQELLILWVREMITGAYRPIWAPVMLDDGAEVMAIAFIADPAHPLHELDARVPTVVSIIAEASGRLGSNAEYVFKLDAALREHGLADSYVDAVARQLKLHPGDEISAP